MFYQETLLSRLSLVKVNLKGRFLEDLGGQEGSRSHFIVQYFVANLRTCLIGVKQQRDPKLLNLPLNPPSASLTPRPGLSV